MEVFCLPWANWCERWRSFPRGLPWCHQMWFAGESYMCIDDFLVSNMVFIFHFIYGMSSQPHWRTPSFFKMVIAPPTRFSSGMFPASHAWFPDGKRLRKPLKPWSMSSISYGAHEHIILLQQILRMKEDTSIFGPVLVVLRATTAVFTVFTEI